MGPLVTLVVCPQQNENHWVNKATVMKTCLAKVIDIGQTEMIDASANQFSIVHNHLEHESTYYLGASNNRNGIPDDMEEFCKFKAQ